MNNEMQLEAIPEEKETPIFNKNELHEFALTTDQYIIIQHYLPKGYSLIEKKSTRRDKTSTHKIADQEVYFV